MSTTTTRRISGTASGGKTSRVSGIASGGATSRVNASGLTGLLDLEGDAEHGNLLLEGDMNSSLNGCLMLEGDMQGANTIVTRRIAEAVA